MTKILNKRRKLEKVSGRQDFCPFFGKRKKYLTKVTPPFQIFPVALRCLAEVPSSGKNFFAENLFHKFPILHNVKKKKNSILKLPTKE
jgi:hypothetical protein